MTTLAPSQITNELEGAKAVVNAKGGELTPLAKMYDSKGTSLVPTSRPSSPTPVSQSPSIGDQLEAARQQALNIQSQIPGAFANEQTVGESLNMPTMETGPSFEDIYGEPIDEGAIRRQQLQMFQGQIDATNQVYDQMLNEARLEGQGRLGSQRAMAARGGLLGSDFGASQKQKVQHFNTDINRSIQAERTAAIGAILGDVRSAVQTEIANKRAARQQGAENYLNYLSGESDRKRNNINLAATALLTQGIDPSNLDENELGAIAMEVGSKPADIIMAYQQMARQQQSSGDQFTLKRGEQRFDAQGNLIAEGPESAADFGTIYSTGQGLVRVDPTTGKPELIFKSSGGSGGGGGGETFKSGGLVVSGSEVATIQNDLSRWRGEDGKVRPQPYLNALEQWTANKGLESDFFKMFPPKEYVSATDKTFPKYIRDMAETTSGGFTIGGVPVNFSSDSTESQEVPDDGPITESDTSWWRFWE